MRQQNFFQLKLDIILHRQPTKHALCNYYFLLTTPPCLFDDKPGLHAGLGLFVVIGMSAGALTEHKTDGLVLHPSSHFREWVLTGKQLVFIWPSWSTARVRTFFFGQSMCPLCHTEWWSLPVVCHSRNADGRGPTSLVLKHVLLCRLFWKEASGGSTEARAGTGSSFGWEVHQGVQWSPHALWGGDV